MAEEMQNTQPTNQQNQENTKPVSEEAQIAENDRINRAIENVIGSLMSNSGSVEVNHSYNPVNIHPSPVQITPDYNYKSPTTGKPYHHGQLPSYALLEYAKLADNKIVSPSQYGEQERLLGRARYFDISPDQVEQQLAQEQSTGERIWKTSKAFSQIVAGALLESIGSLDPSTIVGSITGNEELMTNYLIDLGMDIVEKASEGVSQVHSIYGLNPDVHRLSNAKFWYNTISQIGYSTAMLAIGILESVAIESLTQGAGSAVALERLSTAINSVKDIGKIAKLARRALGATKTIFLGHVLARHSESLVEALDTYNSAFVEALDRGLSVDVAKDIASHAAAKDYMGQLPLLALDLASTMLLVPTSSGMMNAMERVFENIGSGVLRAGAKYVTETAFEGLEEVWQTGVQYLSTKDEFGKHGIAYRDYNIDDQLLDSFLMGAIGAGPITGIHLISNKIISRRNRKSFEKEHPYFLKDLDNTRISTMKLISQLEQAGEHEAAAQLRDNLAVVTVLRSLAVDDATRGGTKYYENHIAWVKGMISAIEEAQKTGDYSKLKEYNVNEKNATAVLEQMQRTLELSEQVATNYNSLRSVGVKPQQAAEITQNLIFRDRAEQERNAITAEVQKGEKEFDALIEEHFKDFLPDDIEEEDRRRIINAIKDLVSLEFVQKSVLRDTTVKKSLPDDTKPFYYHILERTLVAQKALHEAIKEINKKYNTKKLTKKALMQFVSKMSKVNEGDELFTAAEQLRNRTRMNYYNFVIDQYNEAINRAFAESARKVDASNIQQIEYKGRKEALKEFVEKTFNMRAVRETAKLDENSLDFIVDSILSGKLEELVTSMHSTTDEEIKYQQEQQKGQSVDTETQDNFEKISQLLDENGDNIDIPIDNVLHAEITKKGKKKSKGKLRIVFGKDTNLDQKKEILKKLQDAGIIEVNGDIDSIESLNELRVENGEIEKTGDTFVLKKKTKITINKKPGTGKSPHIEREIKAKLSILLEIVTSHLNKEDIENIRALAQRYFGKVGKEKFREEFGDQIDALEDLYEGELTPEITISLMYFMSIHNLLAGEVTKEMGVLMQTLSDIIHDIYMLVTSKDMKSATPLEYKTFAENFFDTVVPQDYMNRLSDDQRRMIRLALGSVLMINGAYNGVKISNEFNITTILSKEELVKEEDTGFGSDDIDLSEEKKKFAEGVKKLKMDIGWLTIDNFDEDIRQFYNSIVEKLQKGKRVSKWEKGLATIIAIIGNNKELSEEQKSELVVSVMYLFARTNMKDIQKAVNSLSEEEFKEIYESLETIFTNEIENEVDFKKDPAAALRLIIEKSAHVIGHGEKIDFEKFKENKPKVESDANTLILITALAVRFLKEYAQKNNIETEKKLNSVLRIDNALKILFDAGYNIDTLTEILDDDIVGKIVELFSEEEGSGSTGTETSTSTEEQDKIREQKAIDGLNRWKEALEEELNKTVEDKETARKIFGIDVFDNIGNDNIIKNRLNSEYKEKLRQIKEDKLDNHKKARLAEQAHSLIIIRNHALTVINELTKAISSSYEILETSEKTLDKVISDNLEVPEKLIKDVEKAINNIEEIAYSVGVLPSKVEGIIRNIKANLAVKGITIETFADKTENYDKKVTSTPGFIGIMNEAFRKIAKDGEKLRQDLQKEGISETEKEKLINEFNETKNKILDDLFSKINAKALTIKGVKKTTIFKGGKRITAVKSAPFASIAQGNASEELDVARYDASYDRPGPKVSFKYEIITDEGKGEFSIPHNIHPFSLLDPDAIVPGKTFFKVGLSSTPAYSKFETVETEDGLYAYRERLNVKEQYRRLEEFISGVDRKQLAELLYKINNSKNTAEKQAALRELNALFAQYGVDVDNIPIALQDANGNEIAFVNQSKWFYYVDEKTGNQLAVFGTQEEYSEAENATRNLRLALLANIVAEKIINDGGKLTIVVNGKTEQIKPAPHIRIKDARGRTVHRYTKGPKPIANNKQAGFGIVSFYNKKSGGNIVFSINEGGKQKLVYLNNINFDNGSEVRTTATIYEGTDNKLNRKGEEEVVVYATSTVKPGMAYDVRYIGKTADGKSKYLLLPAEITPIDDEIADHLKNTLIYLFSLIRHTKGLQEYKQGEIEGKLSPKGFVYDVLKQFSDVTNTLNITNVLSITDKNSPFGHLLSQFIDYKTFTIDLTRSGNETLDINGKIDEFIERDKAIEMNSVSDRPLSRIVAGTIFFDKKRGVDGVTIPDAYVLSFYKIKDGNVEKETKVFVTKQFESEKAYEDFKAMFGLEDDDIVLLYGNAKTVNNNFKLTADFIANNIERIKDGLSITPRGQSITSTRKATDKPAVINQRPVMYTKIQDGRFTIDTKNGQSYNEHIKEKVKTSFAYIKLNKDNKNGTSKEVYATVAQPVLTIEHAPTTEGMQTVEDATAYKPDFNIEHTETAVKNTFGDIDNKEQFKPLEQKARQAIVELHSKIESLHIDNEQNSISFQEAVMRSRKINPKEIGKRFKYYRMLYDKDKLSPEAKDNLFKFLSYVAYLRNSLSTLDDTQKKELNNIITTLEKNIELPGVYEDKDIDLLNYIVDNIISGKVLETDEFSELPTEALEEVVAILFSRIERRKLVPAEVLDKLLTNIPAIASEYEIETIEEEESTEEGGLPQGQSISDIDDIISDAEDTLNNSKNNGITTVSGTRRSGFGGSIGEDEFLMEIDVEENGATMNMRSFKERALKHIYRIKGIPGSFVHEIVNHVSGIIFRELEKRDNIKVEEIAGIVRDRINELTKSVNEFNTLKQENEEILGQLEEKREKVYQALKSIQLPENIDITNKEQRELHEKYKKLVKIYNDLQREITNRLTFKKEIDEKINFISRLADDNVEKQLVNIITTKMSQFFINKEEQNIEEYPEEIDNDDENDTGTTNDPSVEGNPYASSLEKNPAERMTTRIKRLLGSLSRHYNGQVDTGYYGFEQFMDPMEAYNIITTILTNDGQTPIKKGMTSQQAYEVIKSKLLRAADKYPFIYELIERLDNGTETLRTDFVSQMTKRLHRTVSVVMRDGEKGKNLTYTVDYQEYTKRQMIKSMLNSPLTKSTLIRQGTKTYYVDREAVKGFIEQLNDFIANIGTSNSRNSITLSTSKAAEIDALFKNSNEVEFEKIKDVLSKGVQTSVKRAVENIHKSAINKAKTGTLNEILTVKVKKGNKIEPINYVITVNDKGKIVLRKKSDEDVSVSEAILTIQNVLSGLGYKLSYKTIEELFTVGKEDNRQLHTGNVRKLIEYLSGIYNNTTEEGYLEPTKYKRFVNDRWMINKILRLESKYSEDIPVTMIRIGTKNVYVMQTTNMLADNVNRMITDRDGLRKEIKGSSIASKSMLMDMADSMSETGEFDENFTYYEISPVALENKDKFKDGDLFSLTEQEVEITKLALFTTDHGVDTEFRGIGVRVAYIPLTSVSDKKRMAVLKSFAIKLRSSDDFTMNMSSTGEINELSLNSKYTDLLYDYIVLPEALRVRDAIVDGVGEEYGDYHKGAQVFNFIGEFNYEKNITVDGKQMSLRDYIREYKPTEEELRKTIEDNKESIKKTLDNYIKGKVNEYLWWLQETNIITLDDEGKYVMNLDSDYIKNMFVDGDNISEHEAIIRFAIEYQLSSTLTLAESFKLFIGDLANYAKIKGSIDRALTKEDFEQIRKNSIDDNMAKRLAAEMAPGQNTFGRHPQFKSFVLQDITTVSDGYEFLVKTFHDAELTNEEKKMLDAIRNNSVSKEKKAEYLAYFENKYPKAASALQVDATDAQEFLTVKAYLDVLYGKGEISAGTYDMMMKKYEKQLKDIEKYGYVREQNKFTKKDLETFAKGVMGPIKPVYTEHRFDVSKNGKKVSRMVYQKYAAIPLLPQVTFGKLNMLRQRMEQLEREAGMPVHVTFKSAQKVGLPKELPTVDDFLELDTAELHSKAQTLNTYNYRIQQEIPSKINKDSNVRNVSQQTKMLLGSGMANHVEVKLGEKTYTGDELISKYDGIISDYVNLLADRLMSKFDVFNIDNEAVFKTDSFAEKLVSVLREEAEKRGYSAKDINLIAVKDIIDDTIEMETPLWASSNPERYMSLLISIVRNAVYTFKLDGIGLTLVSGELWQTAALPGNINAGASDIVYTKHWKGKLTSENGVIDVFLPMIFKDKNGKKINLFEKDRKGYKYVYFDENDKIWKLKDGVIDDELLEQVSARIPYSSQAFGGVIRIAGFLPNTVGDIMVVPSYIQVKRGVDYDADKEWVYIAPHKFNKGKVEKIKYSEKEYEELKQQYSELSAKIAEKIKNGEDIEKDKEKLNSIRNRIIDLNTAAFFDVHKQVYGSQNKEAAKINNKPLSLDFARAQAEMIDKFNSKNKRRISVDPLSPQYYSFKTYSARTGQKVAIGAYAQANTLHATFTTMKNSPKVQLKRGKKNIPVTIKIGDIESDGRLGLRKALMPRGIKGKVREQLEADIMDAINEAINTATDDLKENIISRVFINEHTINIHTALTLLGFYKGVVNDNGEQRIVNIPYLLINQPIIVDYVKAKIVSRSMASSEYKTDEELIREIARKHGLSEDEVNTILSIEAEDINELEFNVSLDAMYETLKTGKENKTTQAQALKLYYFLEKVSNDIRALNYTLNIGNYLRKHIVEVQDVLEKFNDVHVNGLTYLNIPESMAKLTDKYEENARHVNINGELYATTNWRTYTSLVPIAIIDNLFGKFFLADKDIFKFMSWFVKDLYGNPVDVKKDMYNTFKIFIANTAFVDTYKTRSKYTKSRITNDENILNRFTNSYASLADIIEDLRRKTLPPSLANSLLFSNIFTENFKPGERLIKINNMRDVSEEDIAVELVELLTDDTRLPSYNFKHKDFHEMDSLKLKKGASLSAVENRLLTLTELKQYVDDKDIARLRDSNEGDKFAIGEPTVISGKTYEKGFKIVVIGNITKETAEEYGIDKDKVKEGEVYVKVEPFYTVKDLMMDIITYFAVTDWNFVTSIMRFVPQNVLESLGIMDVLKMYDTDGYLMNYRDETIDQHQVFLIQYLQNNYTKAKKVNSIFDIQTKFIENGKQGHTKIQSQIEKDNIDRDKMPIAGEDITFRTNNWLYINTKAGYIRVPILKEKPSKTIFNPGKKFITEYAYDPNAVTIIGLSEIKTKHGTLRLRTFSGNITKVANDGKKVVYVFGKTQNATDYLNSVSFLSTASEKTRTYFGNLISDFKTYDQTIVEQHFGTKDRDVENGYFGIETTQLFNAQVPLSVVEDQFVELLQAADENRNKYFVISASTEYMFGDSMPIHNLFVALSNAVKRYGKLPSNIVFSTDLIAMINKMYAAEERQIEEGVRSQHSSTINAFIDLIETLKGQKKGKITTTTTTKVSFKPTEAVNHSGGAIGADSYWGEIGNKYGVKSNHYFVEGFKTPNGNYALSAFEVEEADEHLKHANRILKRKFPTGKPGVDSLLRRNWWQVKNADAVFAIGYIKNGMVEGGTAWAVQMALDNNKPVHLFNQYDNTWYRVELEGDKYKFTKEDTPVLTKNFAGIGSRRLTEAGKRAIENVYAKTFGGIKTETTTNVHTFIKSIKKTNSGNVVVMNKRDMMKAFKEGKGIITLRVYEALSNGHISLDKEHNFGNPFTGSGKKGEQIVGSFNTIEEAVTAYYEWLTTDKYDAQYPELLEKKKWIIRQILSGKLDGQKLLYYKELNKASHANVLDHLVKNKSLLKEEAKRLGIIKKKQTVREKAKTLVEGIDAIARSGDATIKDVLQFMLENTSDKQRKAQIELLLNIIDKLDEDLPKVRQLYSSGITGTVQLGKYIRDLNMIRLNTDYVKNNIDTAISDEEIINTTTKLLDAVIHETVHYLTISQIKDNVVYREGMTIEEFIEENKKNKKLSKNARELFNLYSKTLDYILDKIGEVYNEDTGLATDMEVALSKMVRGERLNDFDKMMLEELAKLLGIGFNDLYGLSSVYEFIAEAMSNRNFQKVLTEIKHENKSLFEKLIDTIKAIVTEFAGKVLGANFKEGTVAYEAVSNTISLMFERIGETTIQTTTTNVGELIRDEQIEELNDKIVRFIISGDKKALIDAIEYIEEIAKTHNIEHSNELLASLRLAKMYLDERFGDKLQIEIDNDGTITANKEKLVIRHTLVNDKDLLVSSNDELLLQKATSILTSIFESMLAQYSDNINIAGISEYELVGDAPTELVEIVSLYNKIAGKVVEEVFGISVNDLQITEQDVIEKRYDFSRFGKDGDKFIDDYKYFRDPISFMTGMLVSPTFRDKVEAIMKGEKISKETVNTAKSLIEKIKELLQKVIKSIIGDRKSLYVRTSVAMTVSLLEKGNTGGKDINSKNKVTSKLKALDSEFTITDNKGNTIKVSDLHTNKGQIVISGINGQFTINSTDFSDKLYNIASSAVNGENNGLIDENMPNMKGMSAKYQDMAVLLTMAYYKMWAKQNKPINEQEARQMVITAAKLAIANTVAFANNISGGNSNMELIMNYEPARIDKLLNEVKDSLGSTTTEEGVILLNVGKSMLEKAKGIEKEFNKSAKVKIKFVATYDTDKATHILALPSYKDIIEYLDADKQFDIFGNSIFADPYYIYDKEMGNFYKIVQSEPVETVSIDEIYREAIKQGKQVVFEINDNSDIEAFLGHIKTLQSNKTDTKTTTTNSGITTTENTFTDTSVQGQFKLTKDQQAAKKLILDFIEKEKRHGEYITIMGEAGTGKTTLASEVIVEKVLEAINKTGMFIMPPVTVIAYTHKAKNILVNKLKKALSTDNRIIEAYMRKNNIEDTQLNRNKVIRDIERSITIEAKTYDSLIGTTKDEVFDEFVEDEKKKRKPADGIVLIDEVSMIDEQTINKIFENVSRGASVIMFGDYGQLPPIGSKNPGKHAQFMTEKEAIANNSYNPAFNYPVATYELKEKVRQVGENPIIEFASRLHKAIEELTPDDLIDRKPSDVIAEKINEALKGLKTGNINSNYEGGMFISQQELDYTVLNKGNKIKVKGGLNNSYVIARTMVDLFLAGETELVEKIKIVVYRNKTKDAYNDEINKFTKALLINYAKQNGIDIKDDNDIEYKSDTGKIRYFKVKGDHFVMKVEINGKIQTLGSMYIANSPYGMDDVYFSENNEEFNAWKDYEYVEKEPTVEQETETMRAKIEKADNDFYSSYKKDTDTTNKDNLSTIGEKPRYLSYLGNSMMMMAHNVVSNRKMAIPLNLSEKKFVLEVDTVFAKDDNGDDVIAYLPSKGNYKYGYRAIIDQKAYFRSKGKQVTFITSDKFTIDEVVADVTFVYREFIKTFMTVYSNIVGIADTHIAVKEALKATKELFGKHPEIDKLIDFEKFESRINALDRLEAREKMIEAGKIRDSIIARTLKSLRILETFYSSDTNGYMRTITSGNAITSHKSQGSTYDITFVDIDDILGTMGFFADKLAEEGNIKGAHEKVMTALKSVYTAITRSSKTTVLVANNRTLSGIKTQLPNISNEAVANMYGEKILGQTMKTKEETISLVMSKLNQFATKNRDKSLSQKILQSKLSDKDRNDIEFAKIYYANTKFC